MQGSVISFIPRQNDTHAAVVQLSEPIEFENVTGDILVLEPRYVGATWKSLGIVHVELCDFLPEPTRWQDRRKGKWAESHATYKRLAVPGLARSTYRS